ncbi:hypothetical protein BHC62_06695 [Pseudomonas sp. 06C 126]|jgi:hypothetical protein|nr:hypothetical protein BHC62_06695 [Pseudomonas sp. 06C 126]QHG24342.1 hypothetical protein GDV60_16345 [Pseudomonas sp. DTU12.1]
MSFGMRIWGADGALQLDETSFTVRVIYSALIPKTAGRFIDIAIAGVTPATDSCVCIPIVPYSTNGQSIDAIAFIPYVYEGYVRVFFGSPAATTGPTGLTTQRLIVMRNR